jgi:1,4-alpha-glucan branching enzyme
VVNKPAGWSVSMSVVFTSALVDHIIKGRYAQFATVMGLHKIGPELMQVAVFLPGACAVDALSANGKKTLCTLSLLHAEGLFCGQLSGKRKVHYRLRVVYAEQTLTIDDPYRFPPLLDSADLQLFVEGRAEQAWQMLGAHRRQCGDSDGVHFVVWAPTALRVSVLLAQNNWDGRVHVMHQHAAMGLWELFVPGIALGAAYKLEGLQSLQRIHTWHLDPFATVVAKLPKPCSLVAPTPIFEWHDHGWLLHQHNQNPQALPLILRELTLSQDLCESGMHWSQLASAVLPAFKQQGCTHVVLNHLHTHSGKPQQDVAFLATPAELGTLEEMQSFVEQAHQGELAVVSRLSMLAVLQAHVCTELAQATARWSQHAGALKSIVLALVDYWVQQLHVDGIYLSEVDALLLQMFARQHKTQHEKQHAAIAREWLGELLGKLRHLYPALLIVVETDVKWVELTQPVSKGGMGADYRLPQLPMDGNQLPALPTNATSLCEWLQQATQQALDGNHLYRLQKFMPPPTLSDELMQLLLLAQWTLPARLWLAFEGQLQREPNWQPEWGHDWRYVDTLGSISAECAELMQRLNLLYQQSPALYELDASHEGITVFRISASVFMYQRLGRHYDDRLVVVINGSELTEALPWASLVSEETLRLYCGAGRHANLLPATLVRRGSAAAQEFLHLPAFTAAIYGSE